MVGSMGETSNEGSPNGVLPAGSRLTFAAMLAAKFIFMLRLAHQTAPLA